MPPETAQGAAPQARHDAGSADEKAAVTIRSCSFYPELLKWRKMRREKGKDQANRALENQKSNLKNSRQSHPMYMCANGVCEKKSMRGQIAVIYRRGRKRLTGAVLRRAADACSGRTRGCTSHGSIP